MKKIINKLREQPENVRRHVLHITTMALGVILVLLWIYSLGTNLTSEDTQAKIGQDLKPLSSLKANLIDGYYSLPDQNIDTEQKAQ